MCVCMFVCVFVCVVCVHVYVRACMCTIGQVMTCDVMMSVTKLTMMRIVAMMTIKAMLMTLTDHSTILIW